MKISLIVYCVFILVNFNLSAQNNNYTINLRATTTVSGKEFFMTIKPIEDCTKIVFKFKVYTKYKELEADTNYKTFYKILKGLHNLMPINDTVKIYLPKLINISHAYTVYDMDSIIVPNSKNGNYVKWEKS